MLFVFHPIPDWYKTQEISDRDVYEDPFMIVYCLDCLAALKFIPDWFFTSKMLEKFDNGLHANDVMLFFNEDFKKVTLVAN